MDISGSVLVNSARFLQAGQHLRLSLNYVSCQSRCQLLFINLGGTPKTPLSGVEAKKMDESDPWLARDHTSLARDAVI